MGIKHGVITCVDRDDLEDGGAEIWVQTIRKIRELSPGTTMETLIGDFAGKWENLQLVLHEKPDVLSHNLETVRRLTKQVRVQAKYDRSLEVLKRASETLPRVKSGMMLGLGETKEEVLESMSDLRANGVNILTLGQYLQPTKKHLPVAEFITPETFAEYKTKGLQIQRPPAGSRVLRVDEQQFDRGRRCPLWRAVDEPRYQVLPRERVSFNEATMTSPLKDRITEDMKAAMRAKDADRLLAIRGLLAACKQREVDERIVLDDAAVVAIVDKLVKQRKDSITAFEQGGRADLVAKEQAELKVLEAYLPQRLSADEVNAGVAALVAELGASGPGDMGKVMGAAKARFAGKADMGLVSAAVKQALAN